ncbi:hypothetical protein M2266_003099 [Streptomyces sp. SPB162]|nr:hypothetical protein [Streptomyces sp. SPB162]
MLHRSLEGTAPPPAGSEYQRPRPRTAVRAPASGGGPDSRLPAPPSRLRRALAHPPALIAYRRGGRPPGGRLRRAPRAEVRIREHPRHPCACGGLFPTHPPLSPTGGAGRPPGGRLRRAPPADVRIREHPRHPCACGGLFPTHPPLSPTGGAGGRPGAGCAARLRRTFGYASTRATPAPAAGCSPPTRPYRLPAGRGGRRPEAAGCAGARLRRRAGDAGGRPAPAAPPAFDGGPDTRGPCAGVTGGVSPCCRGVRGPPGGSPGRRAGDRAWGISKVRPGSPGARTSTACPGDR